MHYLQSQVMPKQLLSIRVVEADLYDEAIPPTCLMGEERDIWPSALLSHGSCVGDGACCIETVGETFVVMG